MSEVVELHRSSPAVEVRDLRKEFSRRDKKAGRFARKKRAALQGVTFTIERGECVAILGQNGSGKSTLVRALSTLLLYEGGSARVFGHDVQAEPGAVRRLVNRVSVEASFFKKLSPMENLMYGARLYSVDPTYARARAKEILLRLGVEDRSFGSPMEDMSRGMQQKVAIARAFLTAPVLLLLDEPTTGLDPHSKREVQAAVLEIRNTHDATVMLTTHDMQEADELCDRIAIVDKGRIVALDTPMGLKEKVREPGEPMPSLEDVFLRLTGKKLEEADQENEESNK